MSARASTKATVVALGLARLLVSIQVPTSRYAISKVFPEARQLSYRSLLLSYLPTDGLGLFIPRLTLLSTIKSTYNLLEQRTMLACATQTTATAHTLTTSWLFKATPPQTAVTDHSFTKSNAVATGMVDPMSTLLLRIIRLRHIPGRPLPRRTVYACAISPTKTSIQTVCPTTSAEPSLGPQRVRPASCITNSVVVTRAEPPILMSMVECICCRVAHTIPGIQDPIRPATDLPGSVIREVWNMPGCLVHLLGHKGENTSPEARLPHEIGPTEVGDLETTTWSL